MKVDFNTTVGKIAEYCNSKVINGGFDTIIETITSDSRDLGNNNLFLPIIGEKFDGHDYIQDLSAGRKIKGFLTMKDGYEDIAMNNDISLIRCNDTVFALGAIASCHRDNIDPHVVGITGTNGKTTTKELLYTILNEKKSTLRNEKNYNNEIGVPFTLLGLKENHEVAVVEMGMNHSGELDRLSRISKPDTAVITNVGEGHLEFLGTVENVALAKSEIMHGMEPGATVLINADSRCFNLLSEKAAKMELNVKTFGISDNADIFPEKYNLSITGVEVVYKGESITVQLYGIHNVYNIMAAISAAEELEIGPVAIKDALADFSNVDGRSQIIDKGYIIIDDTYNSNPLSSKYALKSVKEIFPSKRKIAVLSDMKELGESSEHYHSETGKLVGENSFDMLCVYGDMSGAYKKGALTSGLKDENIKVFESKSDLIKDLSDNITDNDVVLVKGSRSMKMEEIVKELTK